MIVVDGKSNYSAAVDLRLLVDGLEYEVSQVAGDTFYLQDGCLDLIPPGTMATLVITIDDDCFFRRVTLSTGIKRGQRKVSHYW